MTTSRSTPLIEKRAEEGATPRTLVVAELSANHRHDLGLAKATLEAFAEAGADAIKLQTYRPESLTLDLADGYFRPLENGPWQGWRPHDLYGEGALPYDWHEPLFEHARALGLMPFSTPFDLEGVELLEALACPMYKIASLEINHVPLLEAVAATAKPVVISTGAASLGDIAEALEVLGRHRGDITILKCTTAYPTPPSEVNLRAMRTLASVFGTPVGLSDHTLGHAVAVAAVALGASMIEKHVLLDRSAGGIDAAFSMEPTEFRAMVEAVRTTEEALGAEAYWMSPATRAARERARSIFVAEPIQAGERFTTKNVRVVRPAAGMHPRFYGRVLAASANVDLTPGTPLAWHHVRESEP